jgi:hypothetical protein
MVLKHLRMTKHWSPIDGDDHGVLLHYMVSINMIVNYKYDVFVVDLFRDIIDHWLCVQSNLQFSYIVECFLHIHHYTSLNTRILIMWIFFYWIKLDLHESIFLFDSIYNKNALYIFLPLSVGLNFGVFVNTIDLVLVVHLISDDMLLVESFCLYHIWCRTVRYIYKTIGWVEERELCCFFFQYCDNDVYIYVCISNIYRLWRKAHSKIVFLSSNLFQMKTVYKKNMKPKKMTEIYIYIYTRPYWTCVCVCMRAHARVLYRRILKKMRFQAIHACIEALVYLLYIN